MSSAVDVSRRGRSFARRNSNTATNPFSDIFNPLLLTRSLSQFLSDPLFNRNWDVKEDDYTLHPCIDMPGLSKEDVKVVVEGNMLMIRGEGQKEEVDVGDDSEGGGRRRYSGRIDPPTKRYKVDETKAEMKHGVLKVVGWCPRLRMRRGRAWWKLLSMGEDQCTKS